jgi:hypothetical protein
VADNDNDQAEVNSPPSPACLWAWSAPVKSMYQRAVLVALVDEITDSGPQVTVGRLAGLLRISPRAVQRVLATLEGAGLIRRLARFGPTGKRQANAYLLITCDVPAPPRIALIGLRARSP